MRKQRGLLFVLVGVALALFSAYMVLRMARQAAEAPAPVVASSQPEPEPIKKVYVVLASRDVPENVALTSDDLTAQEFPGDFAPAGAVAAPEYAVGKYTTSRVYKGQIIVAPLLAEARKAGQFSARVPDGKVAMAVAVNDAMNSLGALRAGDHVDILLTLDLAKGLPEDRDPNGDVSQDKNSTQLTIQNVEIFNIGLPPGDQPTTAQQAQQQQTQQQQQQQAAASRTVTFILDHQDALYLKWIKDSGGVMDLVVRSPDDKRQVKTEAVTVDRFYEQYRFRFPEPIK